MNKTHFTLGSLALAIVTALTACGGGGDDSKPASIAGVAIDGYLKDAQAFLDLNDNDQLDAGEPSAWTDAGGKFSFSADADAAAKHRVVVLAIAGKTVDQDDPNTTLKKGYSLTAPVGKHDVVSPLTTLVAAKMAAGSKLNEAESRVREQLGLAEADVYKDYVAKDAATHAKAKRVVEFLKNSSTLTEVAAAVDARAAEIQSGARPVAIDFAAVAGNAVINCGSDLTSLGTTNASGTLKDLRFYISNVKLVKSDGSEAALTLGNTDNFNATKGADSVTLIDLEDKTGSCAGTTALNTSIKGTVPAGDYVGVKMTLGVPFSMNHTDQSADVSVTPAVINNAVNPGMAWSWAGGRKFTKIEVTNAAWTAPTFTVHLGSTGCTGTNPAAGQVDSCDRPNRLDFGFTSFNPEAQKVAVDVQALLSANDVTVNAAGSPGCMSGATDPECSAIFDAFGLDLLQGIALPASPTQRLFKVISK